MVVTGHHHDGTGHVQLSRRLFVLQRVGIDVLASRYGDATHSEARYRPGDPAEAHRIDGRARKRSKKAQKGWMGKQLEAVTKNMRAPEVGQQLSRVSISGQPRLQSYLQWHGYVVGLRCPPCFSWRAR